MHQNPFSAGALPGPRWGSLRRSPGPPSRLGRGMPPPHWGGGYPLLIPLPARRLGRLELGAYVTSVLRPPQHKLPATPVSDNYALLFLFVLIVAADAHY